VHEYIQVDSSFHICVFIDGPRWIIQ